MISVKEALEIALSPKLSQSEQKAYDMICNHINTKIRNNFNGKSIGFQIENESISGSGFHLKDYVSKPWRQEIVINKWKSDYQNGGWKIDEVESKDHYGNKIIKYTLSVDPSYNRDQKLNQLLNEKS